MSTISFNKVVLGKKRKKNPKQTNNLKINIRLVINIIENNMKAAIIGEIND